MLSSISRGFYYEKTRHCDAGHISLARLRTCGRKCGASVQYITGRRKITKSAATFSGKMKIYYVLYAFARYPNNARDFNIYTIFAPIIISFQTCIESLRIHFNVQKSVFPAKFQSLLLNLRDLYQFSRLSNLQSLTHSYNKVKIIQDLHRMVTSKLK